MISEFPFLLATGVGQWIHEATVVLERVFLELLVFPVQTAG